MYLRLLQIKEYVDRIKVHFWFGYNTKKDVCVDASVLTTGWIQCEEPNIYVTIDLIENNPNIPPTKRTIGSFINSIKPNMLLIESYE